MKKQLLPLLMLAGIAAALTGCQAATPATPTTVSTFDSAGTLIRYASAGAGEALILLHGWMGEASTWGSGTRDKPVLRAPAGLRVLALDLRGHGLSGKPYETSAYGAEMARDVVRLMDHLQIKRAHLLGYSMGAFVAGKVVDLAPDRVSSVVYGGSAPVLSTRRVKGFALADAFDRAVQANDMGSYVLASIPEGAPKPTPDQAKEMAKSMYAGQDLKALAACGRAFPQLEVDAARFGTLQVPTLFVYGGSESRFVLDRMTEAQLILPRAEVKVIEGANHVTALRSPQFSSTVVEFVHRHRGR